MTSKAANTTNPVMIAMGQKWTIRDWPCRLGCLCWACRKETLKRRDASKEIKHGPA